MNGPNDREMIQGIANDEHFGGCPRADLREIVKMNSCLIQLQLE